MKPSILSGTTSALHKLILLMAAIAPEICYSQTAASDGRVKYKGTDKMAAVIYLSHPSSVVTDAIKFNNSHAKYDRSNGFDTYRNVRLNDSTPEPHDLHYKAEKSNKGNTTLYLIIGRPNENIGMRTSSDDYKLAEAKELLSRIPIQLDIYVLEMKIKEQDEIVKKAERRLKSLQDDKEDIEKKIIMQESDLNAQKKLLESLKSQKESR